MVRLHESEAHSSVPSIALTLLHDRLDDMTTSALQRLETQEPAYAAMTLDKDRKRAGMRNTLELALMRLAGVPIPETVARATEVVGRERAEQGFPLTALMHSFQLDLRTLWENILLEGRRQGISDDPAFLDGLIAVWEAIDANSVEVVDAYRRAEQNVAAQRAEIRARAFERLLQDSENPAVVAEAALLLNMRSNAALLVVVAYGVPTQESALARCRESLQRSNLRFYLGSQADEVLGIVDPARRSISEIRHMLAPLAQWRTGLSSVDSMSQVARGVRLARAAIRSDTASGIRSIEECWTGAVVASDEEIVGLMAREILTPLLQSRDYDSLMETLEAYLQSGSILDVAARTYRHRNTVRNRLQAVEDATGLLLAKPTDAAMLVMVVHWLRSEAGRRFAASV